MKKEKLYTLASVIVALLIFVIGYSFLHSEQEIMDTTTATISQSVTQAETTAAETTAEGTTYQIGNAVAKPEETSAPSTSTPITSAITTTEEPVTDVMVSDSIITNSGAVLSLSSLQYLSDSDSAPKVYFTRNITPEAMVEIYKALNWTPTGKVAVKLSIGEPPASNYLRPELIKDVVKLVGGTIVECNTAYPGSRTLTETHYRVAEDHGYTDIAPVQILDEKGSMTLPVSGGKVLSENYVGAAFGDYDSYLVLSHFKGHAMAGYGGAIKNISIGLGSVKGKAWIHSGGKSKINPWGWNQDRFCESMADAGKAVSDYLGGGKNIVYINVMNRISIDCDCNGRPEEPDIHDIGIMASDDPVAVDQACLDMVWISEGSESFRNRVGDRNGIHTLESGEEIGLGQRHYRLVNIDE